MSETIVIEKNDFFILLSMSNQLCCEYSGYCDAYNKILDKYKIDYEELNSFDYEI
jgi:hypothetical protein